MIHRLFNQADENLAKYHNPVALGALVFNFVFWGFGFLRMGTTGLTAQALGARDANEIRAGLGRAVLIALAVGAALIGLISDLFV